MLLLVVDFEFIKFPFAETRYEQFPYTRGAERAHGLITPVPVVEVADNRHAARRRRPHCKRHAMHAIDRAHVRAKFLVDEVVRALVEQMQIEIAERGKKRIGVEKLPDFTAAQSHTQLVAKNFFLPQDGAFKKTFGGEQLELGRLARGQLNHHAPDSFAYKRPHHHPIPARPFHLVHAQKGMRIAVLCLDEGRQLGFRYDHG